MAEAEKKPREADNRKKKFYGRFAKGAAGRCDIILRGYLYDGDIAFVILKRISIFRFPKRFLEISSRDLTLFTLLLN